MRLCPAAPAADDTSPGHALGKATWRTWATAGVGRRVRVTLGASGPALLGIQIRGGEARVALGGTDIGLCKEVSRSDIGVIMNILFGSKARLGVPFIDR